ncbi:MAG: FAD-binding oxidoreductase [Alphaproteobacteria bacterium]|jgi:glycine/D-amino acid oxidase-like deaminating enzyme|nr:FAD-binding oxidoreductase [Alphaproteobacteria bacterium]
MTDDLNIDPYWWRAAPMQETLERALPESVDVAIVGAGYAGLSAALTLARGGRSVAVFEKDRPGEGASSRNGGIASGNIKVGFGKLIATAGLEHATAIYREGMAARDDLARFVEQEGIDCNYQPVGRFTGAVKPSHYEAQGRETDLMNRHLGLGAHMVARADQHAEIGSDFYHGGQVRPDMAGVHPGLLHKGIFEKAVQAGAAVHGRTPVTGIRRESDGFEVATPGGVVRARDVIVATNGYTGEATPWLRRRIVPTPSQIISTESLAPEVMDRLMPKRRMLGETRNIYHYFRPSPDGTRIVFGGRAGAETDDPVAKMRHLRRNLVELFPELRDVGIENSWWGYTGYTFDFLPKLAVHDGIHYATGFCGSGVVWARWIATKAAHRILGNVQEAETIFGQTGFQTRPLYFGRPWFLPAVIAWYGLMDRYGR